MCPPSVNPVFVNRRLIREADREMIQRRMRAEAAAADRQANGGGGGGGGGDGREERIVGGTGDNENRRSMTPGPLRTPKSVQARSSPIAIKKGKLGLRPATTHEDTPNSTLSASAKKHRASRVRQAEEKKKNVGKASGSCNESNYTSYHSSSPTSATGLTAFSKLGSAVSPECAITGHESDPQSSNGNQLNSKNFRLDGSARGSSWLKRRKNYMNNIATNANKIYTNFDTGATIKSSNVPKSALKEDELSDVKYGTTLVYDKKEEVVLAIFPAFFSRNLVLIKEEIAKAGLDPTTELMQLMEAAFLTLLSGSPPNYNGKDKRYSVEDIAEYNEFFGEGKWGDYHLVFWIATGHTLSPKAVPVTSGEFNLAAGLEKNIDKKERKGWKIGGTECGKDIDAFSKFINTITPVLNVINATFEHLFPDIHAKYKAAYEVSKGSVYGAVLPQTMSFLGLVILINMQVVPHVDQGDDPRGVTVMAPSGVFTEGELVCVNLLDSEGKSLQFNYPSGSLVFLKAGLVIHYIKPFVGDRYSMVLFTRASWFAPAKGSVNAGVDAVENGEERRESEAESEVEPDGFLVKTVDVQDNFMTTWSGRHVRRVNYKATSR